MCHSGFADHYAKLCQAFPNREEPIRESQWHLLTRCTLLSLAPARAAASPDTDPSSAPAPWPAPAGSGGGGGGAAPMGGGGTGGGGGGGGPPDEAGITAAPLGWPGGSDGPEMQRTEIRLEARSPPAHRQGHAPAPNAMAWQVVSARKHHQACEEWEEVLVSMVSQLHLCPPERPCHWQSSPSSSPCLGWCFIVCQNQNTDNASQFISGIFFCFSHSFLYGDNKLHRLWLTSAFQENCGLQWHILLSVMQKVFGLSQFCRITSEDSSSTYSKVLQSSSQQQPVGRANGNSIAVFYLSLTGQLNIYTSPREFPHVCSARTSCSWYGFTASVVQ